MTQHRLGQRRLVSVPAAAPSRSYTVDELTSAIADGELDPQLLMLQDAVARRLDTLTTRSTATALLELSPGDRVEINHTARPKYLHGHSEPSPDSPANTSSSASTALLDASNRASCAATPSASTDSPGHRRRPRQHVAAGVGDWQHRPSPSMPDDPG